MCIDFFWAAHHSSTQHAGKMYSTSTLICRTRITPPSPFKKVSAVSALSCSCNYDLCSIAMRVSRVRATRRRGTAELFAFPEAPASHEQVRAQACQGRKDRSCHKARQTRPSPFPRARGSAAMLERLVISTGNHALRGAVNWGAEKNRIVTCAALETDKSDPHKTWKTL